MGSSGLLVLVLDHLVNTTMFFLASVCSLLTLDGSQEVFDGCIIAVHAPDALRILGEEVTYQESRVLGAFQYVSR